MEKDIVKFLTELKDLIEKHDVILEILMESDNWSCPQPTLVFDNGVNIVTIGSQMISSHEINNAVYTFNFQRRLDDMEKN